MSFTNKVCIITGGNSGLGKGIAIKLAQEGAIIVIVGRSTKTLDEAKNEIISNGTMAENILAISVDISKKEDIQQIVDMTITKYGKIDVLVNNAGVLGSPFEADTESFENFEYIFNTNVHAVVHLCKAAIPYLKVTKGNIVNISSVAALLPSAMTAYYSMSKAALDMYTKCLASKLTGDNVRVNGIMPGAIKTPMFSKFACAPGEVPVISEESIETVANTLNKNIPMKRCGLPIEIANAVAFLASDGASYISGSILVVDGALLCHDKYNEMFN
uniref:3-oxoacyl-[acyl-carrier-protein] reductase n=1 Tax=Rhabditophanes sp. KR3021 TaxID=114890 RepID=A0AC35UH66_9BILA